MSSAEYEENRVATIAALESVYRRCGAGCCLHVVTDDGNYDSIDWVLQNMNRDHADCLRAAVGLTRMRRTGRIKAIQRALYR